MKRPSAELVLSAYVQGAFPMAHPEEGGEVYWYAPDPRAILPLDERFHVSRRLRQRIRKEPFEIVVNRDFDAVIEGCAAPREQQEETWISTGIHQVYRELFDLGFCHSVEAWEGEELVGGLYGVAIGGFFAGESMFHRRRDASKVCLVYLVERLRARGYSLLDIQFMTSHLSRFGAVEIPKSEYEERLARALQQKCSFV